MINQVFNMMIITLMARFMLNDIPHMLSDWDNLLPIPVWAREQLSKLGGIKSTMPAFELFSRWPVELYHITFSGYLHDIMDKGLIGALAKEKGALQELAGGKEPIRGVYLTEDWEGILETMGYAWVLNLSPSEEVVILKVDIPKNWKLIPDPELTSYDKASGRLYVNAAISLDPIPSSMISEYKRYTEDEVVEMRAI